MSSLGTLEDLPQDYRRSLSAQNLVPLWPSLRNLLPHGQPTRRTQPTLWRYAEIRPDLIKAGELTPIEKAERRVLVLANPGFGPDSVQATASIYLGLQLILPGEVAPNHRHSPSAIRFVVEGEGGFTVINGEKCPMGRGDLILTPSGLWHEHGHEGKGPVVWLDALDLPLIHGLELSYAIEGQSQSIRNEPDASQTRYVRNGLIPYEALDRQRATYPLLRYPWTEVRAALEGLSGITPSGHVAQLAYINPETGGECLPTLGFSALMVRPGEEVNLVRRSASAVLHVIEGEGSAEIDGVHLTFTESDTFAIPPHAQVRIANASGKAPLFMFMTDDAPLQRKLGVYEVFGRGGS